MGHLALYRQWRPKTFDEVVEQTYTVAALKQSVITGNIAHAYLFSGTRGTGKTTMALLFSRAINCLAPENGNPCNQCKVCLGIQNGSILDVVEMDAASNNSVDTIRRICDEVVFSPSIARFKVYIIDEVHMLSAGAFNALLKTLEEPPAHAVFLLATTEPHRIPATILSRCQRYEFRRIPVPSIVSRLEEIAKSNSIEVSEDALKTIAQLSDGALRDAISLLDQAHASCPESIGKEDVLALVGVVNDAFMYQMVKAIADRSADKALNLVEQLVLDGRDIIKFTSDLALYFRNVMICQLVRDPSALIYVPDKTITEMKSVALIFPLESIFTIIRDLSALVSDLKWSSNPRIIFEIALIKMMDISPNKRPVTLSESEKNEKKEPAPKALDPIEPELPVDPFIGSVGESPAEKSSGSSGKTSGESLADIKTLWPKILENVIAAGHMTLYLFLLPAAPHLEENRLVITFDDKDRLNHKELSDVKNLNILSDAAHACLGFKPTVTPCLASELSKDASDENAPAAKGSASISGAEALKKSAEELGIAFYIEE
jgi:DNA polymerase III subunit gamma/tau